MARIYDDFEAFAQDVQRLQDSHLDWERLNGQKTGSDRKAWAYFKHMGRKWKVDADTKLLPLLLAYRHYKRTQENPFREVRTEGKQYCLVLIDTVQNALILKDHTYQQNKYYYIYSPMKKKKTSTASAR